MTNYRTKLVCSIVLFILCSCESTIHQNVSASQSVINPKQIVRPRNLLKTSWKFKFGDTCVATAYSSDQSLEISVSSENVTKTVYLPQSSYLKEKYVQIRFTGISSTWLIKARRTKNKYLVSSNALDEFEVSKIILLLGGGTLKVGETQDALPSLHLPNSGQAGRGWVDCVRKLLLP